MTASPSKSAKRCAIDGCRAKAVKDFKFCSFHMNQRKSAMLRENFLTRDIPYPGERR